MVESVEHLKKVFGNKKYLKDTFINSPAIRVPVSSLAVDPHFLSKSIQNGNPDFVRVAIFWIAFLLMMANMAKSLSFAFRNVKAVTRFLSTCSPEDANFDTNSALKQLISQDKLEKIIFTIENKFSIGILEKRHKFFKDQGIMYK